MNTKLHHKGGFVCDPFPKSNSTCNWELTKIKHVWRWRGSYLSKKLDAREHSWVYHQASHRTDQQQGAEAFVLSPQIPSVEISHALENRLPKADAVEVVGFFSQSTWNFLHWLSWKAIKKRRAELPSLPRGTGKSKWHLLINLYRHCGNSARWGHEVSAFFFPNLQIFFIGVKFSCMMSPHNFI